MTRRQSAPLSGAKYCGNTSTREVHDLDRETGNCQIAKIIRGRHAKPFRTISAAHAAGYDNCHWCIGRSRR